MISLSQITGITKDTLGISASVWQVNAVTTRIEVTKESFVDIFQSLTDSKKFAFHAQLSDGRIFRLDCRPERKYRHLETFPWHLHKGKEATVVASPFSTKITPALSQFLKYIANELAE